MYDIYSKCLQCKIPDFPASSTANHLENKIDQVRKFVSRKILMSSLPVVFRA